MFTSPTNIFLLGAWKPSHLSKGLEFKILNAIFVSNKVMSIAKTMQKKTAFASESRHGVRMSFSSCCYGLILRISGKCKQRVSFIKKEV